MNRRRITGTIVVFIIFLFLSCFQACKKNNESHVDEYYYQLATFYVSPEGNDNNSGSSPDQPFKTLSHAIFVVKPGQIIELLQGTYREEVIISSRGNIDAEIIIRGQKEQKSILDGNRELDYGIYLRNCVNFKIKNLEFKNYKGTGLNIEDCSYISVLQVSCFQNGFKSSHPDWEGEGFGLNVDTCNNLLIDGVVANNNGPGPSLRSQGIMGTGINTYVISDAVIRNCTANENIGGGFLIEDSFRVVFENNTAKFNECLATEPNPEDNWWDAGLWLDGGHSITIKNNSFNRNIGPGIQISNEDRQEPYGYKVENNEIRYNLFGIFIWNFGDCPFPGEEILLLNDNIISNNTVIDIWCAKWDY